jgi:integrase
MALSDVKLRQTKPREKPFKISDGEGLFILINPNGSKLWRMAYRFDRKQKLLAFGRYPDVSLLEARRKTQSARDLLADKVDPGRKEAVEPPPAQPITFGEVALEWLNSRDENWADSTKRSIRSLFERDVIPVIGTMPMAAVRSQHVLSVSRLVEQRGALYYARRVMQNISLVFRYAIATQRAEHDPTYGLSTVIRSPSKSKPHASIPAKEMGPFLDLLDAYPGEPLIRYALTLTVLTFVRTNEIRFAQWSEFEGLDGGSPLWRIPAERMKMGRPHVVPLSRQSVALLRDIHRLSPEGHLFPSHRRGTAIISDNTMLSAMHRMGYRATVHGFRHLASTVLNEHDFNRDWIELQLAHVEGGVRGVYNAAQYLTGRREMMQWWADWLDEKRAG